MDLGPPISYLVLERGTAVVSSDGERVGRVAHVLAAEDEDVFDGIVIEEEHARGEHRFVNADEVAEIHQDGVLLKLTHAQADTLPKPTENPAVLHDDPAESGQGELSRKLRRAWDYISGNH